jgi:hypothetical protein
MNLLIAHLVGDYLFQNRWMAMNKHKRMWICALHAIIYALSIYVFTGWPFLKITIVFLTHFLIDILELGKFWRLFFSRDAELPWTILADNTMHLLILWALSTI